MSREHPEPDPGPDPGQNRPRERTGSVDAWLTPGRFSILLALSIAAAFPEVVSGLGTFYYRDFGFFGYPLANYHRERFLQGEIPLWNPLNNCGLPFLAQWNTLVLYPGSLFYLLLPLSWSLGVFCLLHQFVAGLGFYFLARHWTGSRLAGSVGGAAFAFSGLTLNCLMWPNNIAALAWMPWVILLALRSAAGGARRLASLSVVGAMQMLTGAPEIILLTWVTACVLVVAGAAKDRPGGRSQPAFHGTLWVGLGALGVALASAGQLLPFLDLVRHAHRDPGYGDSAWAMPAWGWANLVVPLFRCFRGFHGVYWQQDQYWTSSYYPGAAILALALAAVWRIRRREVWLLAGLAGLGFVLALGDAGFLFGWLRRSVPWLGFMRYPIKFIVLVSFAVPALAVFAVAHLQDSYRDRAAARRAWAGLAPAWIAVSGAALGILIYAQLHPGRNEDVSLSRSNGLIRVVFLALTAAALHACGRISRIENGRPAAAGRPRASAGADLSAGGGEPGSSPQIPAPTLGPFPRDFPGVGAALALVLSVVLDLEWHAPRQNPVVSRQAYQTGILPLAREVRPGEARAMVSPANNLKLRRFATTNAFNDYICDRQTLFANCNLLDEIPKVDGFFSLYLREGNDVRAYLYESTNAPPAPLCDFLGVSHITDPDNFLEWKRRPGHMPLASVGQHAVAADDAEAFRAITSPVFDPRATVYLPPGAPSPPPGNEAEPAARLVTASCSAQLEDFTVEARTPAWLVVAQGYYHPWRATIDGRPAAVHRANYAFQAIEVPAGAHAIRLVYRDWGFAAGMVLAILGLGGCAAFLLSPAGVRPSPGAARS